jgi:hypothetical protein
MHEDTVGIKQRMRWTYTFCVAVMVAGCFMLGIARAEFNYKRYRPYSLAQAVADHTHDEEADWVIAAGSFKYRVRVTYTGQRRDIKVSVRQLIANWVKSLDLSPKILDLFKQEILVREDGSQYWLPIQEELLPHVAREIRTGDLVDLYIMRVGSTQTESVFIVNEFQARRVTK